jgi:hypothetical protein
MSASDFVTLRSGVVMPAEAIRVVLNLEERGLHFDAEGDALVVGPKALLTDVDRANLRRWRNHILDMLAQPERVQ